MTSNTLPLYAADWLAKSKANAGHVDTLTVQVDVLANTQSALFESGQTAIDGVREARGRLAQYDDAVKHGERPADPAERQRLLNGIAAAQRGADSQALVVSASTRVASGTRTALDRTIKRVAEMAGEAAEVEPAKVTVPRGATIATQRGALADLDDQDTRIEHRLRPKAEVHSLARASLNTIADRGRLRVGADGSLYFPEVGLPLMPLAGSVPVKVVDGEAMFAALHHDALAAQVDQAVERMYRDVPDAEQMTAVAKKAARAKIQAQRFEVELVEVALVFLAWAEGRTDVGLRPDTNADAILQIRGWKPGR